MKYVFYYYIIIILKMFPVLKKYLEYFYNLLVTYNLNEDNLDENNVSIQTRMKKLDSKFNSNSCHPYKPHIFSLKSKKILSYINTLTSYEEKMKMYKSYNNVVKSVCAKLYDRFNPTLIYTFNNEIHLVFYYNDYGNYQYEGNIHKTLSIITSYVSIIMNEELKHENIFIDFTFECTFQEFDIDYETLNYLIWRQFDCKRNIISLLYKCHNFTQSQSQSQLHNLSGSKLQDLEDELYVNYPQFQEDLNNLIYGTIIKKEIIENFNNKSQNSKVNINKHFCFSTEEGFEVTKESNVSDRKKLNYKNFWLYEDFSNVMEIYITNKFLLKD